MSVVRADALRRQFELSSQNAHELIEANRSLVILADRCGVAEQSNANLKAALDMAAEYQARIEKAHSEAGAIQGAATERLKQLEIAHAVEGAKLAAMTERCALAERGHAELCSSHAALQTEIENLNDSLLLVARNIAYASDLKTYDQVDSAAPVLKLMRLLKPLSVVGFDKVRVGGPNDGGYILVDDFDGVDSALSLGVGDDMSWDLDMASRGISVHQYDHTIEEPPAHHSKITFHRERIATAEDAGVVSVAKAIEVANSEKGMILKIDIEHDEWNVLDNLEKITLSRFNQIICEFHWFGRGEHAEWLNVATRVLVKLNHLYQVVHIHGNNCAPYSLVYGIPLPSVLEVTFVCRSRYEFTDLNEIFPGHLDKPNNPTAPDLYLGNFTY